MIRNTVRILATLGFLTAAPAAAQPVRPEELPGWSIAPGFQTLAVYEDNLLVTPGVPTKGPYTRLTPSIETRYRGPLGFFTAEYSFDSEVHPARLRALDNLLARQVGAITFASKPSARSSISGLARYIATERPEELLEPTGLVASERRTKGLQANFNADHKVSETWQTRFGYALTLDDFGQATEIRPGARDILHSIGTAMAMQKSEKMTLAFEYTGKVLNGEGRTVKTVTTGLFWSNTAAIRWTDLVTPHITIEMMAGPRVSQAVPAVIDAATTTPAVWEYRPEVRASVSYRNKDQRLSIAYARSQELGYGAAGFIDTESVELKATRSLGRRLQVAGRGAVYENTLAGLHAQSYRLEATGRYMLTPWMSVDGVFSYRYQDRSLALSDLVVTSFDRSRTRNRTAVGVTIRRPIRME